LASQTLRLKSIVGAMACGVLVSLATGVVQNEPEIGIPEYKYYGYPLVWLVTRTSQPTEFRFPSLAVNIALWVTISFLVLVIREKVALSKWRVSVNYKVIFLPLVLFIPLGLVMDFVHEFGHAMWGTAVGGRLTYMKIAYLEIYPRLALTPEFALGYVRVEGLKTEFASGLTSLGGSMTTNIASWLIALILLKTRLGNRTQVALKVLGLFGLLDLPFYVLFPQIGLRHWIFLGGSGPEPLLGAREMGIPDPVFYVTLVLTTLGLAFLYFKSLWRKLWKRIKFSHFANI